MKLVSVFRRLNIVFHSFRNGLVELAQGKIVIVGWVGIQSIIARIGNPLFAKPCFGIVCGAPKTVGTDVDLLVFDIPAVCSSENDIGGDEGSSAYTCLNYSGRNVSLDFIRK